MHQAVAKLYKKAGQDTDRRIDRILFVYDYALKGCVAKDLSMVEKALDVMESKMKFREYPELGLMLAISYRKCRDHARAGRFRQAGLTLSKLRKAWAGGKSEKAA